LNSDRPVVDKVQEIRGVLHMIVINPRPLTRQRWLGEAVAGGGPERAGAQRQRQGGLFGSRPGRPRAARPHPPRLMAGRELDISHDFLAGALAEDARSETRQTWLGLVLAAGMIALLASGYGLPLLGLAFCLAPVVGIGMEIFGAKD